MTFALASALSLAWRSITRGALLATIAGWCAASGGGLYDGISIYSIVVGTVLVAFVTAVVVMRRIRPVLVVTERDFESS